MFMVWADQKIERHLP